MIRLLRLFLLVFLISDFLVLLAIQTHAQDGPTVEIFNNGQEGGGSESVSQWRLPVRVTVSLNAGYDENASTSSESQGSVFTSAGVNLSYEFGTSRTRASLSTGTGLTYYPELDTNRYDPNLFLNLSVVHQVNLRLTLSAALSIHYQSEPDFSSNLTVDRRAGNYFSTADSISAAYQWLPRFSTVTGYAISTVLYDDSSVSSSQNRVDHSFTESFRFLYLPVTTIVADYALSLATYDGIDRDSHVQSFLIGFDHTISARLQGTLRGGVELRATDNPAFQESDGFSPHAEASLSYVVGAKTSLSWNASYGTQESYVANSGASTTFRTGLQASYAVTSRVQAIVSGNYQHNESQTAEFFPGFSFSFTEDALDFTLGLNYSINRYFIANAGYSRTEVESDFGLRSYSRNRYYGGLTLSF